MQLLSRQAAVRGAAALLLAAGRPRAALSADDGGIGDAFRRAVVRGAQLADQADSVWQQVAGEVVPAWEAPVQRDAASLPPPFVDAALANALLSVPLQVGARCAGVSLASLEAQLPAARQEAVVLYGERPVASPLQDEPFYGAGAAVRGFPRALATDGGSVANATLLNFEVFVRWRVLQRALSDGREPAERRQLQACFAERLGDALLDGPLRGARLPEPPPAAAAGRRDERTVSAAVEGCGGILAEYERLGLFTRQVTTRTLGSGTDLFDAADWAAGGSTSWQHVISGSTIVGASQLSQDRTANTGLGAGLFPGQLLTAPLGAHLRRLGIRARCDEFFLDNRIGRPDPRSFSDPSSYAEVLLEVVALEE